MGGGGRGEGGREGWWAYSDLATILIDPAGLDICSLSICETSVIWCSCHSAVTQPLSHLCEPCMLIIYIPFTWTYFSSDTSRNNIKKYQRPLNRDCAVFVYGTWSTLHSPFSNIEQCKPFSCLKIKSHQCQLSARPLSRIWADRACSVT